MGAFTTGTSGSPGNTPFAGPSTTPTQGNYASLVSFAGTPHIADTYNQQIKRFGNRMLMGWLEAVSAEESLNSDKIEWTEEGRLHFRYTATFGGAGAVSSGETTAQQFTITGPGTAADHGIRVKDKVILSDSTGKEQKGRVLSIDGAELTIESYGALASGNAGTSTNAAYLAGFPAFATTAGAVTLTVYGTEYEKGSDGVIGSIDRDYIDRSNNPTIQRGGYKINGSDAAQIGWVETYSESGESNGMFWWHTSELDERERFMDYLEMSCLEDVPAASTADIQSNVRGSEGLFYVLENRANVFTGGLNDADAKAGRDDIDKFVKQLDANAAIMENMLYLNREESLAFDNILALQNGDVGAGATQVGTNWGMFDNNDQALDLGFRTVKRGSYTFHKSDWKYLNDYVGRSAHKSGSTLGVGGNLQGVMIPGGSSNVYDQGLGKLTSRPYIHIRYRQAGAENRKFKNWVTGSVGGVYTNNEDSMTINYLSERCLVTQAPNNFVLLKRE